MSFSKYKSKEMEMQSFIGLGQAVCLRQMFALTLTNENWMFNYQA